MYGSNEKGQGKRQHKQIEQLAVCWRFLCPKRMLIPQAHRITAVALHHGVFQGIVFSSGKHYGKEYRKWNDNRTSLINRLIRWG